MVTLTDPLTGGFHRAYTITPWFKKEEDKAYPPDETVSFLKLVMFEGAPEFGIMIDSDVQSVYAWQREADGGMTEVELRGAVVLISNKREVVLTRSAPQVVQFLGSGGWTDLKTFAGRARAHCSEFTPVRRPPPGGSATFCTRIKGHCASPTPTGACRPHPGTPEQATSFPPL